MPPDHEPAALRTWQRRFAGEMREPASPRGDSPPESPPMHALQGIGAADRIGVYRNNSRQAFRSALALTYPVLRRRVGDDYWRQLAHHYRSAYPSRSGDLHRVGAAFPAWLESRLAGTAYAWLADLARLEWACEEAAAAASLPPLPLATLATVPPEALDDTALVLQPSLRLVRSTFPVWSVWKENQGELPATPVDTAAGPEHCACACTGERVAVYRVALTEYALLASLRQGAVLGDAMEAAGSDAATLAGVVDWAFGEGLVVAISPSARA
jgi:hypothetical protein